MIMMMPVITNKGAVTTAGTVPVAMGTMFFGTQVPADQSTSCLDHSYDIGMRFWDTANNYAFWAGGTGDESETVLGDWFATRGPAARDDVVLATKVGARPRPGGTDLTQALGLSAPMVRTQALDSLRRLRTDYIDLLYAHIDDSTVPLAETLGGLGELVEEGLVRQIAASNLTAPRLKEAVGVGKSSVHGYTALQQRFSYLIPSRTADLSPHVLLDDQIEFTCTENDLTMLGYSPLLSGAYTRPDRALPDGYNTSTARHALNVLSEVAEEASLDTGQTVLAWMARRSFPVLPVVGVSSAEQVASAWQAVTSELTHDAISRLETARTGA
jgi:aryl-alcohol dehydrogenase-like predicted oxidoreductase